MLVINPGSAGGARDSSNVRQLSCAVLDTATEEVVVIHNFAVKQKGAEGEGTCEHHRYGFWSLGC